MYNYYNMAKVKEAYPNITFEQFLAVFLNYHKRLKELSPASLKVSLDNTNVFKEILESHLKDTITLIGDYDVDGITSLAILSLFLEQIYPKNKIIAEIPNRFIDGYGLNKRLVEEAIARGSKLIITVDNGIKANDAISLARQNGIDVLVTDHHVADLDDLPNANCIINPHMGNDNLVTKEICGAMTIFLVARQILTEKGLMTSRLLDEMAELAAIGTICDVMPLVGENRQIVKYLINLMNRNEDKNLGISKLMSVLGQGRLAFNVESVSYGLGPCLNAPGRLDTAFTSYKLLMSHNPADLEMLAGECDRLNGERKSLTASILKMANAQLSDDMSVNILYFDNISEGIIGIIAGKVCENTHKPTFVFTNSKSIVKGSGRAPEWCNLIESASSVLKTMSDMVVGYGGHAGAMGLSLKDKSSLEVFKARYNALVKILPKTEKTTKVIVYPKGYSLKDVKTSLDKFGPFGQDFEEPIFVCETPIFNINKMGEAHTRFTGYLNDSPVNFYAFFMSLSPENERKKARVYFRIHKEIADSIGTATYSLYVQDVKII